ATFRPTAAAKQTTAMARTNQPVRALCRPVTMPAIATTMQATAMTANTTASARSAATPSTLILRVGSIHLHHLQAVSTVPARPGGPQGHLAFVPARGEDRSARVQRGGQVEPTADHGRSRYRVRRA